MQLDKAIGAKLAMDVGLFDIENITRTMQFMNLAMMWLIRVVLVGAGTAQHPAGKTGDANVNWQGISRGHVDGYGYSFMIGELIWQDSARFWGYESA